MSNEQFEPGYTGDGFTEERDDGWPVDAHPDEVEHDRLRTTYPDMLPFGEANDGDDEVAQYEGGDEYDDFYGDDDYEDFDDDGYSNEEFEDEGDWDFYVEVEDIVEGETYGRYIGPGSDTLPESADLPPVWVEKAEAPEVETFTCDGCGEVVTVWCSRCYCGKCCCKCTHDDEGDGGNAPKPAEPTGRRGMPLAALILI